MTAKALVKVTLLSLATAGMLAAVALPTHGLTTLLEDDFNYADGPPDAGKWTVAIPPNDTNAPPPKDVVVESNQAKVMGRAHLNTLTDYDPNNYNGLTINCQWTFGTSDRMAILTRSSGTPNTGYGDTTRGVESYAVNGYTAHSVTITPRSVAMTNVVDSTLPFVTGETYDVEMFDDGYNVALTMKQVGGNKVAVATAAGSSAFATNLITFHNREKRTSYLDDVVISEGMPDRDPVLWVTKEGFTVRQVTSTGTVDNLADADALLAPGSPEADQEATAGFRNINFADPDSNNTSHFAGGLPFLLGAPAAHDANFALVAEAQLIVPEDGEYIFGVNSGDYWRRWGNPLYVWDDGSRLKIDGSTVIDDAALNGNHAWYGRGGLVYRSAYLTAGLHDLELVYFERSDANEEPTYAAYDDALLELFVYTGAGQRVLLQAVPEPAAIALLLAAVGFLCFRRRVRTGRGLRGRR